MSTQPTSSRGPAFDPSLLEEGPNRDAVHLSHPLTTDSIQIATPTVKASYSIIDHVVTYRLPGTNFVGDPRIGKTRAQLMISKMLPLQHPKVPLARILALRHDRPSEARIWGDLAESLGLTVTTAREPVKARNKIVNAITTQCSVTGGSVFVFLCDEVQNWGEAEWSYLKDLGNILDAKGVRLVSIGFGQEQLREVKERLRIRPDLIHRFLKVIHQLGGIQSHTDLHATLEQLDDPKFDYPSSSGICYSEFFMPRAYRGGWRLAAEAANLWAAFNVVARSRVQRPASNVGMSSVVLALKAFFAGSADEDSPHFRGTRSAWLEAVRHSEYEQDLC